MLQLNQIKKTMYGNLLFKEVTLQINDGEAENVLVGSTDEQTERTMELYKLNNTIKKEYLLIFVPASKFFFILTLNTIIYLLASLCINMHHYVP